MDDAMTQVTQLATMSHAAALEKYNEMKTAGADQLEVFRAEAEVATWNLPLARAAVAQAHAELANAHVAGASDQVIQLKRLALDAALRQQQGAQDYLADVRARVSDLSTQRLTEAAIKASQTTASATIALVIVTAVLIVATLVAALLARDAEPAALPSAPTPTATR